MRKYRILTAAAAVLGLVALPAVAVPAAQASTSVVVYACGMAGNWRCPAVRPSEVGFGALWDIAAVRWTHWTVRSAYGAGQYWLNIHAPKISSIISNESVLRVDPLNGAAPHRRARWPSRGAETADTLADDGPEVTHVDP